MLPATCNWIDSGHFQNKLASGNAKENTALRHSMSFGGEFQMVSFLYSPSSSLGSSSAAVTQDANLAGPRPLQKLTVAGVNVRQQSYKMLWAINCAAAALLVLTSVACLTKTSFLNLTCSTKVDMSLTLIWSVRIENITVRIVFLTV